MKMIGSTIRSIIKWGTIITKGTTTMRIMP